MVVMKLVTRAKSVISLDFGIRNANPDGEPRLQRCSSTAYHTSTTCSYWPLQQSSSSSGLLKLL